MRKSNRTFAHNDNGNDCFYDLFDDYELIEASFAQQYGIRLRRENDMQWTEFCNLLAALGENTPLGRVVSIRAENDPRVIQNFSASEREIHARWRQRRSEQTIQCDRENYDKAMQQFKEAFIAMAGGGKE